MKIEKLKRLIVVQNNILKYKNLTENLAKYEVLVQPVNEKEREEDDFLTLPGRMHPEMVFVTCKHKEDHKTDEITPETEGNNEFNKLIATIKTVVKVALSEELIDPVELYNKAVVRAEIILGDYEREFDNLMNEKGDIISEANYLHAKGLINLYYKIKGRLSGKFTLVYCSSPYDAVPINRDSDFYKKMVSQEKDMLEKQMQNILDQIEKL